MATITPLPVAKVAPSQGPAKMLRLPCRQIEKLAIAALFLAAACSSDPNSLTAATDPSGPSRNVNGGMSRAMPGNPRRSGENPGYDTVGIASWYGRRYHGRQTANGEIFDMNAPTAAHPTLPFGSRVHITNLENGRSVTVRINDRGPFVRRRIIDVSQYAAQVLGFVHQGTAKVRVQLVQRGG